MRKPQGEWFLLQGGVLAFFNMFPANGIDLPIWLRAVILGQLAIHLIVYFTLSWAYSQHTKGVHKICDEYRETIRELYERIEKGGS